MVMPLLWCGAQTMCANSSFTCREIIMGSLSSKNALVTGSTSGIGLAIPPALAAEGANVTINGLGDPAAIEQERAGIEKVFGVKSRYSDANMMDGAAVSAMV